MGHQESVAKVFGCFLSPDAEESDTEFRGSVWMENGGITSPGKRRWMRVQIALAFIGMFPLFFLGWCCVRLCRQNCRCSYLRTRAASRTPGHRGAPLQPSTSQQSSLEQQTHETSLAIPPPMTNRLPDMRILVDPPRASSRLTSKEIDGLVANMPSPEKGSESRYTCCVCLEDGCEDGKRAVLLPSCQHYFHKICITDWLRHGEACCPVCRKILAG